MDILVQMIITFIVALVASALVYKMYTYILIPIKMGKDTDIWTVIKIEGECPEIEQTVDGLLWISRNGILKSKILILDCGMDTQTRELAETIIKRHSGLSLCKAENLKMYLGEIS